MNETDIIINTDYSFPITKTKSGYLFFKRTFDIIFSLIACLFLIPLIIIIKIITLISGDTKTIFFKQKRIGKNGKNNYIYKFRTMSPNAP